MKGKRSYPRSSRIADLVKEEVATLFIYSVNDPRLHGISITDVKMTEDLKVAKIYYVCSNKEDVETTNKGLKSVQGWVRKEISKKLNMRYTPELEFHYDDVFENGMKIDKIFKDIEHGSDK